MGKYPGSKFEVKIVTSDGKPIIGSKKIPVIPAYSIHKINDVDRMTVSSRGFFRG